MMHAFSEEEMQKLSVKLDAASKDTKRDIGKMLREGRDFSNMSQDQACYLLSFTEADVDRIESGEITSNDVGTIFQIASRADQAMKEHPGSPKDVSSAIFSLISSFGESASANVARKLLAAPRTSQNQINDTKQRLNEAIETLLSASGENRLPEDFQMIEEIPGLLTRIASAIDTADFTVLVRWIERLHLENQKLHEALATPEKKSRLDKFLDKAAETAAGAPMWIALLAAYGIGGGYEIDAKLDHELKLHFEECISEGPLEENKVPFPPHSSKDEDWDVKDI